jgi:hypothetical protein
LPPVIVLSFSEISATNARKACGGGGDSGCLDIVSYRRLGLVWHRIVADPQIVGGFQ